MISHQQSPSGGLTALNSLRSAGGVQSEGSPLGGLTATPGAHAARPAPRADVPGRRGEPHTQRHPEQPPLLQRHAGHSRAAHLGQLLAPELRQWLQLALHVQSGKQLQVSLVCWLFSFLFFSSVCLSVCFSLSVCPYVSHKCCHTFSLCLCVSHKCCHNYSLSVCVHISVSRCLCLSLSVCFTHNLMLSHVLSLSLSSASLSSVCLSVSPSIYITERWDNVFLCVGVPHTADAGTRLMV